jgi:hypothetical protein
MTSGAEFQHSWRVLSRLAIMRLAATLLLVPPMVWRVGNQRCADHLRRDQRRTFTGFTTSSRLRLKHTGTIYCCEVGMYCKAL